MAVVINDGFNSHELENFTPVSHLEATAIEQGPLKFSRVASDAAEKASNAGGFLGSFLSTQKGTRKDFDKAII